MSSVSPTDRREEGKDVPMTREEPDPERQEELPGFDFADPLKRDEDDELPGLDPIVTIPPES
jgi:hypothetical protein